MAHCFEDAVDRGAVNGCISHPLPFFLYLQKVNGFPAIKQQLKIITTESTTKRKNGFISDLN